MKNGSSDQFLTNFTYVASTGVRRGDEIGRSGIKVVHTEPKPVGCEMNELREVTPEELLHRGYLPGHGSCSVVCLVQFPLQEAGLVGALLAY